MLIDLTFCQYFLSRDTRKLIDKWTFWAKSSDDMLTCPTATQRHKTWQQKIKYQQNIHILLIVVKLLTFFIWNLIVALTSSTFIIMDSEWVRGAGNLPALFRPGPRRRGICLMRASLARKASYFLAARHANITINSKTNKLIQHYTQILDKFLVLIQLLQSLSIHEGKVIGLGLITVLLVTQNAHLHARTGDMLQPGVQTHHQHKSNTQTKNTNQTGGFG